MAKKTRRKTSQQIEQSGNGAVATSGSVAAGAGSAAIGGNVVGNVTVTNIYPAAGKTAPDALHQLPAPPADFTGRNQELKDIRASIKKGVTIFGIRGMGGVGKTALALKLADALALLYPDAQFFLDLRGAAKQQALSPSDAMRHVVLSFDPTAKPPEDEQQLAALYRSLLHGKKALLLWDNARDAKQVRPLLAQGCLTLVTSRQHFSLPGLIPFDLETLTEKDARALIRKIAPRIRAEDADDIAALCGYLPLAVRFAASALAEREDLTPAAYLERLKKDQARLSLVRASLELSYDLLDDELKARFRGLAIFPVPFEGEAAAAVWGLDADAATDALGGPLGNSLLDYDQNSARYDLHDLVRLFAADRLGKETGEAGPAIERHANYYLGIASACQAEYLAGGTHILPALNRFDEIWPHLEAAWERMDRGWGEAALRPEGAERWLSEFPLSCADVLDLRLPPQRMVPILERAVRAARETGDRHSEGNTLGNLGTAYLELDEARRAIEFHEQALAIARETGDRDAEGNALGNLGSAHLRLDEAGQAVGYFQQALAIARETGDRRGEGNTLGNLGLAYADLGQAPQEIECLQQALAIARESGDRREEGNALGNLGNAQLRIGEQHQAIDLYKQALAITRELGDRRGQAADLNNLGNSYVALGQAREAIECYEQALVIDHDLGDLRAEGQDLNNLGRAHTDLGETRQAIESFEKALAIMRELGDRNGEGADLANLGLAHATLGEQREAVGYYERALAIAREIGDRDAEGSALGNMGVAFKKLGETRRAIEFYEQALNIFREIGDREGEGGQLANLGNALYILGDKTRGVTLMREALQILTAVGSSDAEWARGKLREWGEAVD